MYMYSFLSPNLQMGSTADLSMTSFRGSMTNLGSPSLRHLSTSLMDFSQATSKQSVNTVEQSDKPRYCIIIHVHVHV